MIPFVIERSRSSLIAITALMTSLVFVLTVVFQVSIVATKGYFNVGEIGVFLSALLFGPYVGAFAGGVGSALADLATGYAIYAPGTLVIKGCEGYLTGWAIQKLTRRPEGAVEARFSPVVGMAIAAVIITLGVSFYNSLWSIALGIYINPSNAPVPILDIRFFAFDILLTEVVWVGIAVTAGVLITYFGYRKDPLLTAMIISTLLGGTVMVMGYFIYEYFVLYKVLGMEVIAIVEVPFNIGQAVIGTLIAVPIARRISIALVQSGKT